MRPAVFLDRDGVINENRADYVKAWDEFVFLPGVFEPLRELAQSDLAVVVISNQSAVNRGLVSQEVVEDINQRMVAEIERQGGRVDGIYFCPHRPDEGCDCRKPRPGLLIRAAEHLGLDLHRSYLVGDAASDVQAALAAGCRPFLVLTGRGRQDLETLQASLRDSYQVAADLAEAVKSILLANAQRSARTCIPVVATRHVALG